MMKLLFILRSKLLSRKKYYLLACITLTLSAVMFNLVFNVTRQYIADISYFDKNRYENTSKICCLSSARPVTAERINSLFESFGIETEWHYMSNILGLFDADAPFDDYEGYRKTLAADPNGCEKYARGSLNFYDTEYSEFIDTVLVGEKPDINKDYGGRLPVIAACLTPYEIGDCIEYNCAGTIVTVTVVGKYADDNLIRYFFSNLSGDITEYFYTDIELLKKFGIYDLEREYDIGSDKAETVYDENGIPHTVKPNEKRYGVNIYARNTAKTSFPEFEAKITAIKNMYDENDPSASEKLRLTTPEQFYLTKGKVENDNQFLIKLLPLFIMIFIIGTVGITASVILSADSSIKSTAVFKLCGCKNKSIALFAILSEMSAVLPSLIISIVVCSAAQLFVSAKFITPTSFLFTAGYMLFIFIAMTVTEIITLTRNNMLDTVRRFETL